MSSNGMYTRTEGADPAKFKGWPRFYVDTILDEPASARAGRQIYKDVERIEITMPGNPLYIPVFTVSNEHIQRWPEQYKAFKENREPALDGTPLEEWPAMSRSHIAELKFLGIRTIEDVAELDDHALQRIGRGAHNIKARAIAFLDDTARNEIVEKTAKANESLQSENEVLRLRVEEMGKQLNQLQSQFMDRLNAAPALATHIPGAHDPIALAHQSHGQPEAAASSLEAFASAARAPRPAKEPSLPKPR